MPDRHRPNIIVIMTDDQGYGDLGCYGSRDLRMPNIDSLAKGGVRFTDGYVSHPYCSPTRAGLLTGRYQQRFGHEFNLYTYTTEAEVEAHVVIDENVGLPLDQITLADLLKGRGYATGVFGKWHLGPGQKHHPLKRGFDEFYGFLSGAHYNIDLIPNVHDYHAEPIYRNFEQVSDEKEYLTDALTREACSFIDRHRDQPFFIYLPYNAPHGLDEATPKYFPRFPRKYFDRFPHIANKVRRVYAAVLNAMDDGVGAILSKLREHDLEQDTLIFFLSDNGGGGGNNGPLHGGKATFWEGGFRVPFLCQWPRQLAGGQEYKQPVISLDIFATAVAAAGGKMPSDRIMDGVDLRPYLTGERQTPPHEILFWRDLEMYKSWGKGYAVRKGRWKLFKQPKDYDMLRSSQLQQTYVDEYERPYRSVEAMYASGAQLIDDDDDDRTLIHLYDLSTDIGETNNLVAQHPEVVEELLKA